MAEAVKPVQQTQVKPVQQTQVKPVQDKPVQGNEVHTVAEYEAGAKKLFGVRPYTVRAAFMKAKKTEASLDEAKALVKAFAEKKVK